MTGQTRHPLPDLVAMEDFGGKIARVLRAGDVVALEGGLGAGKTTLARAIISSLGYDGEVPSPTFTIIETYEAPPLRLPIVHADFYRLESPDEVNELLLQWYLALYLALLTRDFQEAANLGHSFTLFMIGLKLIGQTTQQAITNS